MLALCVFPRLGYPGRGFLIDGSHAFLLFPQSVAKRKDTRKDPAQDTIAAMIAVGSNTLTLRTRETGNQPPKARRPRQPVTV